MRAAGALPRVAILVLAAVACGACATMRGSTDSRFSGADVPRTILMRGENLAAAKLSLRSRNSPFAPAYLSLIRSADSSMLVGPYTVMQKKTLPPSGNRHDFISLAPYWWPDTTKPGGLPYVRRDGVMNPTTRVDHDGLRFQQMIGAVGTLALAHYFSADQRYARRAGSLLRVWFLDTATRMNPHLQFAQAIPGVTEGRGLGIIDSRHLPQLVDALRLLENAPGLSLAEQNGIASWLRDYLRWLRTSRNGMDERDAENNHGTWYDVQVASLAIHLGDMPIAREVLGRSARLRIASQITADGRQPLELARTRPLHYSLFNLEAWSELAEMGRHAGVDLWRYVAPAGGSLRAAVHYVAPFADAAMPRPAGEVAPVDPSEYVLILRSATDALGDPAFARAMDKLPRELTRSHRTTLAFSEERGERLGILPDSVAERALGHAAKKLRLAATTLDPRAGFPRFTRADGSWAVRPATQWTSGFFAGSLWYMYQLTRDPEWRALAERWTMGMEEVKTITRTHDLGFMLFDTFGHGFLLTGNPHYRDVVLTGSTSLATRFNPRVGAIKSWDTERQTDRRSAWKYPVIVDNLMNLEMLFWAGINGGNPDWWPMAEQHALLSARTHVRANGSTAHVALFDPVTGALERTVTWQGYSDSSAWSRGQAWAIHGLTASFRHAKRPELLAAAVKAADYFIGRLPPDGIPFWDLVHPGAPNTERDASAAAIAASGLLELARFVEPAGAARYRASAERILVSLTSEYLTEGTKSAAILQHSVGGRPQNTEIDVGIVYADYYFVEALLRHRGIFRD